MAATPFERARAIPTSAYTSEVMLAAELDRIFRREWICVGRVDQLNEPGDYLTYEIAGQPRAGAARPRRRGCAPCRMSACTACRR